MSRWIDADWLLNFFEPYPDDYQTPLGTLRACVDDAPTLVRCRDCKYEQQCRKAIEHITYQPTTVTMGYNAVDYCSYGKRKEWAE